MASDLSQIQTHLDSVSALASEIGGHLTPKEVRFVAALPFVEGSGAILEIGSFKGRSTVVLAKSAQFAGRDKVHACDPLNLPCETDPDMDDKASLARIFHDNLEKHKVTDWVELHQQKSFDLALTWQRPLRILWIDGDHTYEGALKDFDLFMPFLLPGSIVAMHDVLHDHPGPARVFMERILTSESIGDCGLCGSIGWGQYLGDKTASVGQWKNKIDLYRKMSRLIPGILARPNGVGSNKFLHKFYRTLVPHGEIDARAWLAARNNWNGKAN